MQRFKISSLISFVLSGIVLYSASVAGGDWSYQGPTGPSYWGNKYPFCNLQSQSPINIYEGDITPNSVTQKFSFKNYDTAQGLTMTLSNSGHSAVVALSGQNLPEVSGGGLGGDFVAVQFHFHWSVDEKGGSEHLISTEGFASELHIVHYKKKYKDLGTAVNKSDGLAVLGFMLEISAKDNPAYSNLVTSVKKVVDPDTKGVKLPPQSLNSFLPSAFEKFYRYSGSLTTPACYESVTWTVFKEPIKISREQLNEFMDLVDKKGGEILHNVRPVMPLNGREVKASYDPNIQWGYHPGNYDTAHWSDYYESCGGSLQSPINIPSKAASVDTNLGRLDFKNFGASTGFTMSITNTGYTVKVSYKSTPPSVSGGGLPDTYNVGQFHLHWGATSMQGSEHTLDAKMYPMEIHIVTYKKSLGSLGKAVKKPQGLAVLGFFFDISDSNNTDLDPILNSLDAIQNPGDKLPLNTTTLDSFIPADRDNFYRYQGSLTTPGCYETVIWTVFESTIKISEYQMKKFRALTSAEKNSFGASYPLVNNYRPILSLNSRIIKRNFDTPTKPKKSWTYFGATGTQNWKNLFTACASEARQSPIDIDPSKIKFLRMPVFEFTNFNTKRGVTLNLINNGYSATVTYESGDLQVSGGGLPNTFKVVQYHFHWGSVDSKGSEHTVKGYKFPMELHIVMVNELYSDINVAVTQPNGLAVLGFMFKMSKTDNKKLTPLVSSLPKIKKAKSEVALNAFPLDSILPKEKDLFYRYDGSLTTPGCDESVTWTIFGSAIPISKKQLNLFRNLQSSEYDDKGNRRPLVDNYRPVQPIGKRTVYSNFHLSDAPSSHRTTAPVFVSVVFTLGKLVWNIK